MSTITIVIPCYNEADSIPELIKQLKKIKSNFKFILVDNGSDDNTSSIFDKLSLPENIELLKKETNTGYGAGIKYGIKRVKTKYCGWMHADLQQNANVLLRAKELIEQTNENESGDYIAFKGLRTGRSSLDNLFTVSVALLSTVLFFHRFWDIAGQPNIFKTSSLKFLDKSPDDHTFEFFVFIYFIKISGTYKRFNAPFYKRKFGSSSWDSGLKSKLIHSKNIFKFILNMRFNS